MFYIDTSSEIPIYTQIYNGIVEDIAKGNLENNDELPSVRQLAKELGINPMTVNKAYNFLKNDGFIEIDRRNGAYISVKLDENHFKKIEENLNLVINEVKARKISKEKIIEIIERSF